MNTFLFVFGILLWLKAVFGFIDSSFRDALIENIDAWLSFLSGAVLLGAYAIVNAIGKSVAVPAVPEIANAAAAPEIPNTSTQYTKSTKVPWRSRPK